MLRFSARLLFLASLGSALSARAEESGVVYSLKNLTPAGISLYKNVGSGIDREYFTFRNATGTHHIIYDDHATANPLAELAPLRDAKNKPHQLCQMELACHTNAFCTGNCQQFYYEMSNVADPSRPTLNRCQLRSFVCQAAAGGVK